MALWVKILILISAVATSIGIKQIFPGYKDDNPIEELVEHYIYQETGMDFDLTPASPEKEYPETDKMDQE